MRRLGMTASWGATLIVAASFFSGVSVALGPFHARPEQLLPALVLLAFLVRPLGSVPRATILVAAWIVTGLAGGVGQPGQGRAAEHTLRLLFTSLPVFLLPALLRNRREAERVWDVFLLCVAGESALALAALAAHALLGTSWGVFEERVLGFAHPMGTLLEPNVLGALAGVGTAAFAVRLLAPSPSRGGIFRAAGGAVLAALALAASIARSAWIACVVATMLALAIDSLVGKERGSARRAAFRLACAAGVLLVVLGGAAGALDRADGLPARTGVAAKVATLLRPGDDPNVRVRLRSYEIALGLFRESPLVGLGHGAMERLPGTEDRTMSWAGNLEIHLLADTGVVGLVCLAGFAALVLVRVLAAALRAPEAERRRHLERFAALLVLLIAAQATETSWLASFWVLFGLALAGLGGRRRADGPLRVLYVHPSDELYGSDRVLLDVVRSLDRRGIEPLVVLSSDVPSEGRLMRQLGALGVPTRRMRIGVLRRRVLASPASVGRYVADVSISTVRLAWLMARERIDLVHGNTVTVFPAAFAARLSGRRILWHVHEIVTDRRGRGALHLLVGLLADRLVVVSKAARASLGWAGSRALIVPNGVAPRPVVPPPLSPPVVAYVGRLSRRKGPGIFLEAAARVASRHSRARFVLQGDEFGGSESLRRELEDAASRSGLADRVEFRPFREDVSDLLTAATVVVSPSILPESFGLVILEAMSFGRPVVASRHGGPAELVVDGETGLLVPPGDAEALANAIDRLLSDPALAGRLGAAGRRRGREHFSAGAQAERFGRLYTELAAG